MPKSFKQIKAELFGLINSKRDEFTDSDSYSDSYSDHESDHESEIEEPFDVKVYELCKELIRLDDSVGKELSKRVIDQSYNGISDCVNPDALQIKKALRDNGANVEKVEEAARRAGAPFRRAAAPPVRRGAAAGGGGGRSVSTRKPYERWSSRAAAAPRGSAALPVRRAAAPRGSAAAPEPEEQPSCIEDLGQAAYDIYKYAVDRCSRKGGRAGGGGGRGGRSNTPERNRGRERN
ncbi:MAG: hypothetical protein RLN62_05750 [Rickettsiales bacterium]